MLLNIYHHTLQSVSGHVRVANFLKSHLITGRVYAIAIGKAAQSMMQGARETLGDQVVSGLVITKQGYESGVFDQDDSIDVVLSSHPTPDDTSLTAGQRLIEFIQSVPQEAHCLFLISGGTSSLVEMLPESVTLDDLQKANQWALANGLSIYQINCLRKSLSCIKGGRLATYLDGRQTTQLLISDVAGDDPSVIGSGLLVPDTQSVDNIELPDRLKMLIGSAPVVPAVDEPLFKTIDTHIIATLTDALNAAADKAGELGLAVHMDPQPVTADVAVVAESLIDNVIAGAPGIYIRGGEPTVTLPPAPGRGGRMQALALAVALTIQGRDDIQVLAVTTDGSDGPGEDAGALVDGHTITRGELEGQNAVLCLTSADAGSFLEAAGDLVQTGPTGTNVTDLILIIKQ